MLLVHSEFYPHLLAQCLASTRCLLLQYPMILIMVLALIDIPLYLYMSSFSLYVYTHVTTFLFILAWVPVGLYTAVVVCYHPSMHDAPVLCTFKLLLSVLIPLCTLTLFMYIQLPVTCSDPFMHTTPISCTYNYFVRFDLQSTYATSASCMYIWSPICLDFSPYIFLGMTDELMPIYAWWAVSSLLMFVQSSS